MTSVAYSVRVRHHSQICTGESMLRSWGQRPGCKRSKVTHGQEIKYNVVSYDICGVHSSGSPSKLTNMHGVKVDDAKVKRSKVTHGQDGTGHGYHMTSVAY